MRSCPQGDPTEADRLRSLLDAHRPRVRSAGYPDWAKAEVAEWARPLHAAGRGWGGLASAVGVSRNTLQAWCAESAKSEHPTESRGPWLPVQVVDAIEEPTNSRGVILTMPSGVCIENVDAELLLRILRERARFRFVGDGSLLEQLRQTFERGTRGSPRWSSTNLGTTWSPVMCSCSSLGIVGRPRCFCGTAPGFASCASALLRGDSLPCGDA